MQVSHDGVVQILQTMAAILAKHGYPTHAAYVSELAHLAEAADATFQEKLSTTTIWGGAGSVCDVYLPWGSPHPADAAADEIRFRSAVIALAQYMNEHAIGSENARRRARAIAAIFEQWNQKGL